ncbi:hypothetical protein QQ045_000061 [Rhodiola kirilowii]
MASGPRFHFLSTFSSSSPCRSGCGMAVGGRRVMVMLAALAVWLVGFVDAPAVGLSVGRQSASAVLSLHRAARVRIRRRWRPYGGGRAVYGWLRYVTAVRVADG